MGKTNKSDAIYWKTIQNMTPAKKLETLNCLYWTARELKAAGLRMQYPQLSEEEIQAKVREIFLYAND